MTCFLCQCKRGNNIFSHLLIWYQECQRNFILSVSLEFRFNKCLKNLYLKNVRAKFKFKYKLTNSYLLSRSEKISRSWLKDYVIACHFKYNEWEGRIKKYFFYINLRNMQHPAMHYPTPFFIDLYNNTITWCVLKRLKLLVSAFFF